MSHFHSTLIHPFPRELWPDGIRSREVSCLYVDAYTGPRRPRDLDQHDFWEIVAVVHGSGENTGPSKIALKPGMILLIPPGVRHAESSACPDFRTIWVGCFWDQQVQAPDRVVSLENPDLVIRVEDLWVLSREQGKRIGPELDALTSALLHRFLRLMEESEAGQRGDLVARAVRFLESRYRDSISMSALAGHLGCSEGYLHRCFRRQTSLTPNDYLKNLRIRQAAFLLSNTDLSIAEVADRTGYSSPFYFSRVFRQVTGHPPSLHRELGRI